MTESKLMSQQLDILEQRFQALRDQIGDLPGARKTLAPALEEVARGLDMVRAAEEAGSSRIEDSPGGPTAPPRQPEAVQGCGETFGRHGLGSEPDLLTIIDRDFNIVMCNWPRLEYGREAANRSQLKCYEIYAHRDSPCEFCQVLEVFATGAPYMLEWFDPVMGRFREIYAFPIPDETGQVVLVAEHVRDIQERKLAEEKLAWQRGVLPRFDRKISGRGLPHSGR